MLTTQTRRQAGLAVQRRAATPSSYDAETRTVELTAATGVRVKRWDWDIGPYWEELEISANAVDLSRVEAGQCPLLDSHSRWSIGDQLGRNQSARIEGGNLITVAQFGESERAKTAEADVAGGTLTGVSIGYRIDEITLVEKAGDVPVYRVTKWGLMEVSLCPVPADPAAGVRSDDGLHPCIIIEPKDTNMRLYSHASMAALAAASRAPADDTGATPAAPAALSTPAPAGETRAEPAAAPAPAATPAPADASAARMTATEALTFAEDARAFGVEDTQVRTWVTDLTPDAARAALLKTAADKQRGEAPKPAAGQATRVGREFRDVMRAALPAALLLRYDPVRYKLEGDPLSQAREWMGMSLLEMGRRHLEANGEKGVLGMSRRELAEAMLSRAHSTSDFPSILANVANKTLRDQYEIAEPTFKAWQRRASATDFKQIQRTQLGDAPSLLLVPEGGQFKMGTIGEGKEVYALATYGRIVSITRQTIINDDLGAFTRVPQLMGQAAADFESDAAYAPLIANPNMGDGVALFHSTHANLAGSGAAIAEATVQAGETAMMSQTGLGGRPINIGPKWMIVAVKDKVAGQKLLTGIQAQQTGNVNVYANAMTLIVEARLNNVSTTPWFMAADCNRVDTIEYAYLEGDDGVYMEERIGFETDGIDLKVRDDFAVKAIDWRGLFKNPGT